MGLMAGLADWLRQIIAVVLLASLIDLLLPNETMQRYVRLVAGLFILLTVASPVLNWMKGDFGSKLAIGLSTVEQAPDSAADQLASIKREGEKLRDKHNTQATQLVTAKLSAAVKQEVEQSEKREVRSVKVETAPLADGTLTVSKITIQLEPLSTSPNQSKWDGKENTPLGEVEPVAAVDISVEIEGWPSKSEEGSDSMRQESSGDQGAAGTQGTSGDQGTAGSQGTQTLSGTPAGAVSGRTNPAESGLGSMTEQAPEQSADEATRLRIAAQVAGQFGLAPGIVEVH